MQTALKNTEPKRPRDSLPSSSSLICRNVTVGKKRTSVRLENDMWEALNDVATLEGVSIHEICTLAHRGKNKNSSYSSCLRVFLLNYFRTRAKAQSTPKDV